MVVTPLWFQPYNHRTLPRRRSQLQDYWTPTNLWPQMLILS